MTTKYPGAIDDATTLPSPNPSVPLGTPSVRHTTLTINSFDAIKAIETKIGPSSATRPSPDVFNVLDYGAKWDGSSDDTIPIQNAINAAHGVGGGLVLFPYGTGVSGQLTMYSNVHVHGMGPGATTIRLKNSAASALFQTLNFATLTGGNTTGGETNFSFNSMTMDFNKAAQSGSVPGIQIYGYGYQVNNVHFLGGVGAGIWSEWSTSLPSPGQDSVTAHWSNFKVHDCAGKGIDFQGPRDSQFVNAEIYNNGAQGIHARGAAGGTQFNNIHSWGLTQTTAFQADVTTIVTGSVFEGSTAAQVILAGNNHVFSGNQIFPALSQTNKIGLQIGIGGTPLAQSIISGCAFFNCTTETFLVTNDNGDNFIQCQTYATSGVTTSAAMPFNTLMIHGGGGGPNSQYQFKNNGGQVALGNNTVGTTDAFGHVEIPGCAGTPTTAPTLLNSANVAIQADTTAFKLWIRFGATWKFVTFT